MTADITIRRSTTATYWEILKLVVLVASSVVIGLVYDQTAEDDNARAQEPTLEDYTANYEAHPLGRPDHTWPHVRTDTRPTPGAIGSS